MNENISWGKIAVLVVAIAGVGVLGFVVGRSMYEEPVVLLVQPESKVITQGKSANSVDKLLEWKTYSNARYGFEMKFPENWAIVENFGKSKEFGYEIDANDSYLTFHKNDGYAQFTFGISDNADDYLGQPRGRGVFDEQVFIEQTDVSGVSLDKYLDVYKNDDSTADIGYFIAGSKDDDIQLNGKYAFIRASLGMNLDGQKITGKKYSKENIVSDADLQEIDKILSTFRFVDQDWKTYKSEKGSLSFRYPSRVCDFNERECYPVSLVQKNSVITVNASEGGSFDMYYGTGISSEKSVNQFLKNTLKNDLCRIDSIEDADGFGIKAIVLDGCDLYGSEYEQYASAHPEAVSLSGKVHSYWAPSTGEVLLYAVARGGGCAFIDCNAEEKISQSIRFLK